MKNKNIIILIAIICTILFVTIIHNCNITTITKYDDTGKAMPESTEIADLQKQIERLQKENEDLAAEISKATAAGDKVLSGEKVWTNGNIEEGTMTNNGELNWTPTISTIYTVPAGYYSGGTLDSSIVYEAGKKNGFVTGLKKIGSAAGTYDLSSYEGYQNFEVGKNILCTSYSTGNAYGGHNTSGTHCSMSASLNISYNSTTGVLIVSNGYKSGSDGNLSGNVYCYCNGVYITAQ